MLLVCSKRVKRRKIFGRVNHEEVNVGQAPQSGKVDVGQPSCRFTRLSTCYIGFETSEDSDVSQIDFTCFDLRTAGHLERISCVFSSSTQIC